MVETAKTIWADGPIGAPSQPDKALIRAWGTWLESFVTAIGANTGTIFQTRAALYANLAFGANTLAWVMSDPTVAYNGLYQKSGASGSGAWTRLGDLPYSFITAVDAGAGTPNAIVAASTIPISSSALVILNVSQANTGSPVTVAFNGGSALTLKTNTGNNVAAGGLVAGMQLLGVVSGSTFRLVSDQVSTAVVAAAEAAAAAALASKNAAATSETNAASSATLANKFANNPEDEEVIVGSGLYSAYHWAKKAAAVVTGGIAAAIHAATAKSTIADSDELGIADSAASWALKKVTSLSLRLYTLVNPYVTLASAATTCDIGAAQSKNVNITGTTGITAFPAAAAGTERWLKFAAALTLTYNATSLILPGLANLTVAAGDKIRAVSLGSGNWELSQYEPAALNLNIIGIQLDSALTPTVAAIDRMGIPANAKRIIISLAGLSTNSTSPVMVQIGTASGMETTGYLGSSGNSSPSGALFTTGFVLEPSTAATAVMHGAVILTRQGNTNTWVASFAGGYSHSAACIWSGGSKTLAGVLDRVRVTTVLGTPVFDAGTLCFSWE